MNEKKNNDFELPLGFYTLRLQSKDNKIFELKKNLDNEEYKHSSLNEIYEECSENVARNCQDFIDWKFVSSYYKLSEEFIREFKDKLDWERISKHQTLSEDFIREMKDYVCWEYIYLYQHLSEDFRIEFKYQLIK